MGGIAEGAGTAISGIAGGASNVFAANAQAGAKKYEAEKQFEANQLNLAEQKRQFDITNPQQRADEEARKKAFMDAITRGGGQMQAGESALLSSLANPNSQLAQQEADIRSRESEELNNAAGQINANLAAQGVRGGQAATIAARSLGSMGNQALRDVNQLKYTDEAERQQALRAYMAAKAQRGQAATLPSIGF